MIFHGTFDKEECSMEQLITRFIISLCPLLSISPSFLSFESWQLHVFAVRMETQITLIIIIKKTNENEKKRERNTGHFASTNFCSVSFHSFFPKVRRRALSQQYTSLGSHDSRMCVYTTYKTDKDTFPYFNSLMHNR